MLEIVMYAVYTLPLTNSAPDGMYTGKFRMYSSSEAIGTLVLNSIPVINLSALLSTTNPACLVGSAPVAAVELFNIIQGEVLQVTSPVPKGVFTLDLHAYAQSDG